MRYLIITILVLVLAACSTRIKLSTPEGKMVGTGTLKFRPNPPHQLTIVLGGKTYEGSLDSEKVDDSAELRQRFGANSKRYQAIFTGLNANYNVYLYSGYLKASDGTTVGCQFLSSYHGGTLGACIDGVGQTYEIKR